MKLNVIKETLLGSLGTQVSAFLTSEKPRRGCTQKNEQATGTISGAVNLQHSISENDTAIPLHRLVDLPAKGSPSFNFNHISFGLTC